MFLNFRTNLPTELMEFEGLSYESDDLRSSFVAASVVTKYLIKFADAFELNQFIQVHKFKDFGWKLFIKINKQILL